MTTHAITTPAGNHHGTTTHDDLNWRAKAACGPSNYDGPPTDFELRPVTATGRKYKLRPANHRALTACAHCPVIWECRAEQHAAGDNGHAMVIGGIARSQDGEILRWTVHP